MKTYYVALMVTGICGLVALWKLPDAGARKGITASNGQGVDDVSGAPNGTYQFRLDDGTRCIAYWRGGLTCDWKAKQ